MKCPLFCFKCWQSNFEALKFLTKNKHQNVTLNDFLCGRFTPASSSLHTSCLNIPFNINLPVYLLSRSPDQGLA